MDNLTLGQQLKNAREALKLSIQEVASQTQLKIAHIDAFENDIFILPNVAPAFARGYVRNYVRFLRLPEELIGSVNYGEVSLPTPPKKLVISSDNRSHGKFLKSLTIIVLLIAFGMTAIWWWQEHQKDQESRETLVQHTTNGVVESSNHTNDNSLTEQTNISSTVLPQTESVHNAIAAVQTNPEIAPMTESEVVSQNISGQTTQQAGQEITEIATPQSNTAVALTQVASNETTPTTTDTTAIINEELRIEIINAESWITVKSGKGKRLAEKLYNAGEVLSFNDNEQYRLTIGAPANVKIYYKGQEVPLKIDGRVARIRLPLAN